MGSRMAKNLQNAGHDLIVHNRTAAKANDLLQGGAAWADSPAEVAAQSEVLLTMLSTPETVRSLAFGANGFLAHLPEGAVWADSSTVDPRFSAEMAAAAATEKVHYLDAPVAGTKAPAENGELLFLVGGDAADLAVCQPLFDIMGKATLHLGPASSGAKMKLLINQMLGQTMLAFAEAVHLGTAMGLPQEQVLNTLLKTPVVPAYLNNVRPKLENADYETNFPLKWMQKDLQLAANMGYAYASPLPSLNAAKEAYAMARNGGFADQDFSSIFAFLAGDRG